MLCTAASFAAPVKAAPLSENLVREPSGQVQALPASLLMPNVECDAAEVAAVCDVRRSAARRAVEVVAEDHLRANGPRRLGNAPMPQSQLPAGEPQLTLISMTYGALASTDVVMPARGGPIALRAVPALLSSQAQPMSLLVPVGLVPVAQNVVCDPSLTAEQCARLTPPPPVTPIPPIAPTPPVQPTPPIVPEAQVPGVQVPGQVTPPGPEVDPVPTAPPSVIPPPLTGDDELVRKPPVTGSNMPVIKPKAAPPPISAN